MSSSFLVAAQTSNYHATSSAQVRAKSGDFVRLLRSVSYNPQPCFHAPKAPSFVPDARGWKMLLTVRDVAKVLAVPENTVEHWASESGLPAMRFAGQYRFNRIDLLEWATIRQIGIDPEVFHLGGDESGETPELAAALERGGVGRSGDDFSGAVVQQVAALNLPPQVDRDELRGVLQSRNTTAYGVVAGGVAVPHPRYPIIAAIDEPLLRLGYLERPTPWNGDPQQRVEAFFLLVSPTVKTHLTLLAVLVGAMTDARFAEAVRQKVSFPALLAEARRFSGENDRN